MKFKPCLLPITKSTLILLALSIPAAALADASMPFTRIFTLGDSLTDGGTYSGTVITGGAPAGKLYKFTTNFTDGSAKVWAEYLAAALGLPLQPNIVSGVQGSGTNYAQGGAQIATDPSIETNLPLGITAFSVRQQVTNLLQQNPRLNAHDQIIVWGGANDVFSALNNVSTAGGTPISLQAAAIQMTQAANDLVTQINRLKAAGATYIIVNTLPNMGQTPRAISDGPGTVALAQSLSIDVFNATLKQALRGSNVVIVDSAKILNAVVSSPATYGFTAVNAATTPYTLGGTSCGISALTCVVPVIEKANANSFIFADGIHPTDAAHALFGQAGYALIQAAGRQATMLFAPAYALRQHTLDLEPRLQPMALLKDEGLTRLLRPVDDTQYWFAGSLGRYDNNASQTAPSYRADTQVLSGGVDRMISFNALTGAALTLATGQSDFGANSGSYNSTLALASLYATAVLSENFYLNATLQGAGISRDSIHRNVTLGAAILNMSGSSSGSYLSARVGSGYVDTWRNWSGGPALSLTTFRTRFKGYTESDSPVSLSYGTAKYDANLLGVAFSARKNGSKNDWLPLFRLGVERDLKKSDMTIALGPDADSIASLPVEKPMRTFYSLTFGAQKVTDKGTGLLAGSATAGSKLATRGYTLTVGYKLPM